MDFYITQPKDYWIAPNAINISLNARGDKNRIQVGVASGAVIMCFVESIKAESAGGEPGNGDGLWYGNNHEPKRWPITASPTYFNSDTRKYVYVAIPRSASIGTQAIIVFPSEQLDIYGRVIRDDSSDDSSDNSSDDEQYAQAGSTDYFYVYLSGIISAPSGTPGQRSWEDPITDRDWGLLQTAQGNDEKQNTSEWFSWSSVNQTVTFLKKIVMSVGSWFQNLILGSGSTQGNLNGVAKYGVTARQNGWNSHVVTPNYLDEFGNVHFLHKDDDDTTDYHLQVGGGIGVGDADMCIDADGDATLADINAYTLETSGDITSGSNVSADGNVTAGGEIKGNDIHSTAAQGDGYSDDPLSGYGFHVYKDANGNGHVATDVLDVRKNARFAVLEIRRTTWLNAENVQSAAASKIEKVVPIGADGNPITDLEDTVYAYRCLAVADDGTLATINGWRVGDQARCQTFNITTPGNYTNVSNRYYWRLVVRVGQCKDDGTPLTYGYTGKVYHFFDLANKAAVVNESGVYAWDDLMSAADDEGHANVFVGYDASVYNNIPAADDSVVQMGSQLYENRMGFYLTRSDGLNTGPYTYAGVNNFSLTNKCIVKITPADVDIRARHISIMADPSAGSYTPLTVYRGDWVAGQTPSENPTSYYYNEWDYQGSRWLYVNETESQAVPGQLPPNAPSGDTVDNYWKEISLKGSSQPDYTQTQEAWSNVSVVASATTMPSDCTESSWSDTTPTNQNNKAYLWRRSRKMVLQSDGTYAAATGTDGQWKYTRLSGTNGTSISVNGTVVTVVTTGSDLNNVPGNEGDLAIVTNDPSVLTHAALFTYVSGGWEDSGPVASDGDSYVSQDDGHLWMWSAEASAWIDLGQFKGDPGTTYYTHVAWATAVTIGTTPSGHTTTGQTTTPNASAVTGFSIAPSASTIWMGVLVNTVMSDSNDGLAYTWKKVEGPQGDSPIVADLNNEHDALAVSASGVVEVAQTIQTDIVLYEGTTALQIDEISAVETVVTSTGCNSWELFDWTDPEDEPVYNAEDGISIRFTRSADKKKVTVSVAFATGTGGAVVPNGSEVEITITNSAKNISRTKVFTISSEKGGVVYRLLPSVGQVVHKKNGSYAPAAITCDVQKNENGNLTENPPEATIYAYLDGSTSPVTYSGAIYAGTGNNKFHDRVKLELVVGSKKWDYETIPVIEDGTDGDDAENFTIETSASEVHYDGDGQLTTGDIEVKAWKKVGTSAPVQIFGNAAALPSGAHYYCAYSNNDGSSWSKCSKNLAQTKYIIPKSAVAAATEANGGLRIRLYYTTATTVLGEDPANDTFIFERDALAVHGDLANNLLRQTLFENGKTDLWVLQFGTKATDAGTDGHNALVVSPVGSSQTWGNTYQDVFGVLAAGTDYTISLWTKSNEPFRIYIDGYNAAYTQGVSWVDTVKGVTGTGTGLSCSASYVNMNVPASNAWAKHELHFATAASFGSGLGHIRLSFRTYKAGSGDAGATQSADCIANVCMPKLERGIVATAYQPHESELHGDDGDDGYSVTLTPSTIIIEQSEDENQNHDFPLILTNAYALIDVKKGGVPVDAEVLVTGDGRETASKYWSKAAGSGWYKDESLTTGQFKIKIDSVLKQNSGDDKYPGSDGQTYFNYYREGRITITVTPSGETDASTLYLDFKCNLNGTFRTTVKGDVETSVAQKITYGYDHETGDVGTLEAVGKYIRSSEENISTLQTTVNGQATSISRLAQTSRQISAEVWGAGKTIDIQEQLQDPVVSVQSNDDDTETFNHFDAFSGPGVINLQLEITADDWTAAKESAGDAEFYLTILDNNNNVVANVNRKLIITAVGSDFDSEDVIYFSVEPIEIPKNKTVAKIQIECVNGLDSDIAYRFDVLLFEESITGSLTRTGIDITAGKIVAQTDKFEIWNNAKTLKTFSIDANGNLVSAGNGYFGGTIRAMNFYHAVCIITKETEGATGNSHKYSAPWWFVPSNYNDIWEDDPDHHGQTGPYHDQLNTYILAPTDYFGLIKCTGGSDIIVLACSGHSQEENYPVILPRAIDFVGKMLSIYNVSNHDMYIRQVDGSSTAFAYGWSNGYPTNLQTYLTVGGNRKMELVSVMTESGTGANWTRLAEHENYSTI